MCAAQMSATPSAAGQRPTSAIAASAIGSVSVWVELYVAAPDPSSSCVAEHAEVRDEEERGEQPPARPEFPVGEQRDPKEERSLHPYVEMTILFAAVGRNRQLDGDPHPSRLAQVATG
jgi:hypothetical protein